MSRFRDDGPPSKRFRNDRNDFSSRGGRQDRRDGGMGGGGQGGGGQGGGGQGGGGQGGGGQGGGGGFRRDDRFKSDRGGGARSYSNQDRNSDFERHHTAPSRVLHVRGLREFATENDVVDAVKQFGRVTYVMMIPRNRQALVEFDTVEDAKRVVDFCENSSVFVCGQPAFFNFSTSDSIKRPDGMGDNMNSMNNMSNMGNMGNMNSMNNMASDNKILCFTIVNPKYPITVDVMQTICSPHGEVLRIIVSKKQGVQAMVEFDNADSARKAKQALNGCDVYSGCCTLQIEFARADITRLNVMKNDKETFDYTNPNPGAAMAGRGALLGDGPPGGGGSGFGNSGSWDDGGQNNSYTEPAFFNEPNSGFNRGGGSGNQGMMNDGPGGGFNGSSGGGFGNNNNGNNFDNGGRFGRGGGRGGGMGGRGGGRDMRNDDMGGGRGGGFGSRGGGFRDRGGFQGGRGRGGPGPMGGMGGPGRDMGPEPGAVLIIYGLASGKFNCDKLFNIFCVYGNVMRVKILRSKEGGAMVNMQDRNSCERAVMNLNNSYFFNSKLSVVFSKQDFVVIHPNPGTLNDDTPSSKDYGDSRNNRFFNPDSIAKTRFSPPTKVLHFFNCPPQSTEEDLLKVFKEADTVKPIRVRIFPVKPGAKSAAGLIEFDTVSGASEAIVAANHHSMPNPVGRLPYSLKLSFSASPIIDKLDRRGDD